MKNKIHICVIIGLVFIFPPCVLAVENTQNSDYANASLQKVNDLEFEVYRNPFISQLPPKEVEEVIEEVVEPELKRETAKPVEIEIEEPVVQVTPPALSIAGLVWNSDQPQAIVNEEIVGIGDIVMGADIVGIHQGGIDISYEGVIFTIDNEGNSSQKEFTEEDSIEQ